MREAFRTWSIAVRSLRFLAPVALIGLGACAPPEDPGYDKLAYRREQPLPAVAAPPPPPVREGVGVPGTAAPELAAGDLPPGVTLEMVQEGQRHYGTVCVACHGAAGRGSPVGPELNDQSWIHIQGEFDQIVQIITTGVQQPRQYPGAMPPRGGGPFSDEEVRAIAAYVYAISHAGGS